MRPRRGMIVEKATIDNLPPIGLENHTSRLTKNDIDFRYRNLLYIYVPAI